MATETLLSASQVADRLGLSRYLIGKEVEKGRLTIVQRLAGPNGAILFAASQVDRLALELAAEKDEEAAALRAAAS